MDRASAAVQQKRKSNHFLITILPRLVGLIWRKRIMFFDRPLARFTCPGATFAQMPVVY